MGKANQISAPMGIDTESEPTAVGITHARSEPDWQGNTRLSHFTKQNQGGILYAYRRQQLDNRRGSSSIIL